MCCGAETHPPKKKTLYELKFMWQQVQSQDLGTRGRLLQAQCIGDVCSDRWALLCIRLPGVESQCVQSCESCDPRRVLRLEVQVTGEAWHPPSIPFPPDDSTGQGAKGNVIQEVPVCSGIRGDISIRMPKVPTVST